MAFRFGEALFLRLQKVSAVGKCTLSEAVEARRELFRKAILFSNIAEFFRLYFVDFGGGVCYNIQ